MGLILAGLSISLNDNTVESIERPAGLQDAGCIDRPPTNSLHNQQTTHPIRLMLMAKMHIQQEISQCTDDRSMACIIINYIACLFSL